jgi:hypothetical protein
MIKLILVSFSVLFFTIYVPFTLFKAQGIDLNSSIYPLDSKPYGDSYADWVIKYWKRIVAIPEHEHPNLDKTGEKCAVSQKDPNVWFLAETFGESVVRQCTIPNGTSIFLPILPSECNDDYPNVYNSNEQRLVKCSDEGIPSPLLKLVIDGSEITSVEKFRVQTHLFNLTFYGDNPYSNGITPGTYESVATGYYVILKPLALGRHSIDFSSSTLDNPTLGVPSSSQDIRYIIDIKP